MTEPEMRAAAASRLVKAAFSRIEWEIVRGCSKPNGVATHDFLPACCSRYAHPIMQREAERIIDRIQKNQQEI